MKAKILKWLEILFPVLIASISVIILYAVRNCDFVKPICSKLLTQDFLALIISVECTLFGFLLAVLALLLQLNNKAIELIVKFNRFPDLIRFSKCAIYSSLLVVGITLIIIITKDLIPSNNWFYYFWGWLLVYNVCSVVRFVIIFYVIASQKS